MIGSSLTYILLCQDWEYFFLLDVEAMNNATFIFLGKQDFSSFCKSAAEVENKICIISNAQWCEDEKFLRFHISGNRFLHGMVRAIVGTLVDVGRKVITREDFIHIIDARDRTKASQSAPAARTRGARRGGESPGPSPPRACPAPDPRTGRRP